MKKLSKDKLEAIVHSATVNEALSEYVKRRQRLRVLEHFGTFDFDQEFDYKKARATS
jgi:hypothetical protein